MKTEFLTGLGLEKDVIDKIMAENGKDVNAAKEALAITKEELKQTKEQLQTANETIEGFKDYDDVKSQVADYKAKYEQAEADKKKIQEDYAFNSKLEAAAKKAGARKGGPSRLAQRRCGIGGRRAMTARRAKEKEMKSFGLTNSLNFLK